MKKILLYISIVALLASCKDEDVIEGTAVSFYPKLVDAVTEGGSSSASLELTGPGTGSVVISVTNADYITTNPPMVNGELVIDFDGDDSESFTIQVERSNSGEDYIAVFSVSSISGDIQDIASGEFKLFVNSIPSLSLPFFDDFESCSEDFSTPELWIEEFEADSKTDRGWGCRSDGVDGSRAVRASAFGGETGEDNAWLIINGSLDFGTVAEAYMTFDIKSQFSGDGELLVQYSEDYSGAGIPSEATWTEIPGIADQLPAGGSGSFKTVAADLNFLVGKKVFIGFYYTGALSSSSVSYELDNVSITDDGAGFENYLLPFADDLNACGDFAVPANFIQERVPGSKTDRGWYCQSQSLKASASGGSTGSVNAWLIGAKPFDFSDATNSEMTFDIKVNTEGDGTLNVMWSTDYSGTGDPTAANWTNAGAVTFPAQSNSFTEIITDLSAADGELAYIALQFTDATNVSSVDFNLDNINISSSAGSGGGGGGTTTDTGDCTMTGTGTVIVSHDFEGCTENFATPDGFIEAFVAGSKTDRGWGCRDDGTDGSRGVRASAFGGEAGEDNAWLIMDPVDVSSYTEIQLTFDVQSPFDGPGDLFVLYSTDYSGSGDPSSASWTQMDNVTSQLPAKGASEFATVTTSPCDMSGSTVYIAWQYVNGANDASSAWSIDNVELRGN